MPAILSVRSDERALPRDADGTPRLGMVVSLWSSGVTPLTRVAAIELQWRQKGAGEVWQSISAPAFATSLFLTPAQRDAVYEIAARYQLREGGYGPWSGYTEHRVIGPTLPPPDVEVVYLDGDRAAWLYEAPPDDLAGYRVRCGARTGMKWEAASPVDDGLLTTNSIPIDQLPSDAAELLVKAERRSGLQSLMPGRLALSIVERSGRVELDRDDRKARGWPGTILGGAVADGELRAGTTSRFLADPAAAFLAPPEGRFLASTWQRLSWDTDYLCPGEVIASDRLRLLRTTTGAVSVYYRWVNDALNVDDEAPLLGGDDEDPLEPEDDWPLLAEEGEESRRPWRPWRGEIVPIAGEVLRFRVIGQGGPVRAVVKTFTILVDAEEVRETLENLPLTEVGLRLPLTRAYRKVRWVLPVLHEPTAAVSVRIVSKNPAAIIAVDASGIPVPAICDVAAGET